MATTPPRRVWYRWDDWDNSERAMAVLGAVLVLVLLWWVFFRSGWVTWRPADEVSRAAQVTPPASAPAVTPPRAAASVVLPPPAVTKPVPGVIKEEKETVVASAPVACVTAEELKKVIKESCEGKTKTVIKYRDRPAVVKAPERPPAPAPAPRKDDRDVAAGTPSSGCAYTSDGNAVLKGTTERQPAGKVLAWVRDEDLQSSKDPRVREIVAAHPKGFVTNDGHRALCNAWSNHVAALIQESAGLRVNNDTRRGPPLQ